MMSWAKVITLSLAVPVGIGLGLLLSMKPSYDVGTVLCYDNSSFRESWEVIPPVERYVVVADGKNKMLLRSLDKGGEPRVYWKTSNYSVCE